MKTLAARDSGGESVPEDSPPDDGEEDEEDGDDVLPNLLSQKRWERQRGNNEQEET